MTAPEIIAGLQQHCPHAWAALHSQFWPLVVGVLSQRYPLLTASDEARDVASNTLLTVVKQVETGTTIQPDYFRNYVVRVAHWKAIDLLRQKRRFWLASELYRDPRLVSHDPEEQWLLPNVLDRPDPQPDPEQRWWIVRQFERLQAAMRLLLPGDRELLERFYFDGEDKTSLMTAFALSEHQFANHKSLALVRLMAHFYGVESTHNSDTKTMYTHKELRAKVATC